MTINIFNSSNELKNNITNPILLQYIDKIDANHDGEISEEELSAFGEENPELYASIFDKSKSTLTQPLSSEDISFDTLFPSGEDEAKKVFINLTDLEKVDVDSFIELGSKEDNDELTSKFWNILSNFDLKKLFNFINTDKDDVLSKEELEALSSIDGTEDNLSLFDLKEFFDIENPPTEIEQEDSAKEDVKPDEAEAPQVNTQTAPQNNSGGGSVSSNYSGKKSNNSSDNNVKTENDVKKQYSDNLSSSKTAFAAAKSDYEDILDGKINDADLKNKKEEMDNAYDSWQEELSKQNPELSENIDAAKSDAEKVRQKISQNEKDIYDNEINLSDYKTNYDTAKNYRISLESKKSELESSVSDLDPSNSADAKKIEAYKNQISSIQDEIDRAKQEEEDAKDKKEDTEDTLDDLKGEKTALENELKEKEDVLSEYMDEAALLASKNTTLKELETDYKDKKDIYEDALDKYKEKLKSEADSKHNDVVKNQKLLSDYENNEKLESYNNPIFDYDSDFADIFNKYLLDGASSSSKNDCGGAVRRALYKAVAEKYGENAASVFKNGYGVIGGDWDDQYLADCPLFTDITDLYSTGEIEQMIQNGELKGAVINYEKYSGSKSGHVEGVTTQGLTSDYTRKFTLFRSKSSLGQAKYHVFIPRSATEQELNEYIQLMNSRKNSYKSPI